jgi:hypothetical protein
MHEICYRRLAPSCFFVHFVSETNIRFLHIQHFTSIAFVSVKIDVLKHAHSRTGEAKLLACSANTSHKCRKLYTSEINSTLVHKLHQQSSLCMLS